MGVDPCFRGDFLVSAELSSPSRFEPIPLYISRAQYTCKVVNNIDTEAMYKVLWRLINFYNIVINFITNPGPHYYDTILVCCIHKLYT